MNLVSLRTHVRVRMMASKADVVINVQFFACVVIKMWPQEFCSQKMTLGAAYHQLPTVHTWKVYLMLGAQKVRSGAFLSAAPPALGPRLATTPTPTVKILVLSLTTSVQIVACLWRIYAKVCPSVAMMWKSEETGSIVNQDTQSISSIQN